MHTFYLKRALSSWWCVWALGCWGSAAAGDLAIGEEILDQAIAHCRQGEYGEAQALLDAILEQLDPPPAVRQLVISLKKQACQPEPDQEAVERSPWEAKVIAGYDSNVTQGITASTLLVGTPEAPLELLVDESYRPRSSRYLDLSLQRAVLLSETSHLTLKASGRSYSELSSYDQGQINILWRGVWDPQGWQAQWALERAELWLGGRYYHSATTLALQLPWKQQPQWRWTALLQRLRYHTQSDQNAVVGQLGMQRHLRWSEGELLVGGGWHWDHASGQRAGGDRSGPQVHLQAYWPVRGWLLSGRWSYTYWASREVFLPGLLETPRRNRLAQWALQGEYPVSSSQSLQISLQRRDSKDRIGLYSYKSWGLSAGWTLRF